jgi:selenocysteine-specific elongation factor
MSSIIVGTAGHIDHGKTTLIRALTGIDTDRLPEEKRRGITIDLGFAELTLGSTTIGFIDVPGHHRFVKNMLAGAHGMDLVMLVIAADESVMPQTREHFEICRMLGVKSGLIVITKSESVDDELLGLVREEAADLVKGSFLEEAPIVSVSARTTTGIDALKETLARLAASVPPRPADLVPRLPIDRSFTVKGFGTVATGTLLSGSINESSMLELLPAGTRVRVRGIQVQGNPVSEAVAGQRTAVNLGGLDAGAVERGMVLAAADSLRSTQVVNTECELIDSAPKALRSRTRVRVHLGTTEVLARVRLFESKGEILPGARNFAQLRFESPVITIPGDRFIIRSYSPSHTIGGGLVLDSFAVKHRARADLAVRENLNALLHSTRAEQVSIFIAASGERGLSRQDLTARTGMLPEPLEAAINVSVAAGVVQEAEGILVAAKHFQVFSTQVINEVRAEQESTPLSRGIARETLRERIFAHSRPEIFRAVLSRLAQEGELIVDREVVRTPDHSLELGEKDRAIRDNLEQLYAQTDLAPPAINEVVERLARLDTKQNDIHKHLRLLTDSGRLVRVSNEFLFHSNSVDALVKRLRDCALNDLKDRVIDMTTFKNLTGISRKHAIPLLEYLDRQHVTRRAGNARIIL